MFNEKEDNLRFYKNRLLKSGCHGKVKLEGQGLDIPNCSQINLGRVIKFGVFRLLVKNDNKRLKSVQAESVSPV